MGDKKQNFPARYTIRALLILGALVLGGCSSGNYYIVEARLVEATRVNTTADVTRTSRYSAELPKLRRVALRAPDSCEDLGAARTSGEAATDTGIMQTYCGVVMAELERTLTRKGFDVMSWDAIRNQVTYEHVAPLTAAARLGADVMFQINSLERTRINPGEDMRLERRYYRANKKGQRTKPVEVKPAIDKEFKRLSKRQVSELQDMAKRLSATVNATAILVDSGQSIWFYEKIQAQSLAADQTVSTFIKCAQNSCQRTSPPQKKKKKKRKSNKVGGSIEALSSGADPDSEERVIYYELVEQALAEMVDEFARGRR